MKTTILLFAFILLAMGYSHAQNTFPSTGNVGIGTTTPIVKLHVVGGNIAADNVNTFTLLWSGNAVIWKSGSEYNGLRLGSATTTSADGWSEKMRITDAGNVGIGTPAPGGKLSFTDVDQTDEPVGITWYSPNPTFYGIHRTAGSFTGPNYQQLRMSWNTGIILDPGSSHPKCYVDIAGNGLRVTSGSVGIGTTDTKGYSLAVNGNAIFTSVKVKQYTSWPDYVFDADYSLPPLVDVENYIKTHKHLPDVTSGAEAAKEGLDLGGSQAQLLKKIEELTLYLIDINKKVERLQEENAALQTAKLNTQKQ